MLAKSAPLQELFSMSSSRVTITDLARSLKLSTCTVSKIMNRSFDGFTYSKETIRRVEEMAQQMGYTANLQARNLRTRKTMLIGFLLPSAQNSVFGALTDHLELELRNHGYQVLIVHSQNDPEAEPTLISSLHARGIDGLIWIPSRETVIPAEIGLKPDLPAVILDRPDCTPDLPFVATDNRAAARELARRIHDLGHRRVGILNAPTGDRSMRERFQGFEDVFPQGIQAINLPNNPSGAKNAIAKLLNGKSKPSAIVALSEPLAIGALSGMRDLDCNIPSDVSFAAFDEFPLAAHWTPRITLVCQDIPRLAGSAVELLLKRIKTPSVHLKNVRVQAAIKWRDSVTSHRSDPL